MHTLTLESLVRLVRSGLNFSASVNFSRGKLNARIQEGPKKELLVDRRVAVYFTVLSSLPCTNQMCMFVTHRGSLVVISNDLGL